MKSYTWFSGNLWPKKANQNEALLLMKGNKKKEFKSHTSGKIKKIWSQIGKVPEHFFIYLSYNITKR
jgi:hypothetical protein